jgi:peptidoglycan/LPS O-acetylase OafA/YrhL
MRFSPVTLKTHRFVALDGMRGVAAIAVLLFHVLATDRAWIFPSGGLAVDFFFILSGFVIAYAYEDRLIDGFSKRRFVVARLIRLYPLIVAGAVLGFVGYFKVYSHSELSLAFITGLLLLPSPLSPQSEGGMAIAINPPSWSLSLEIIINLVYMLIVRYLSNRLLLLVLIVSALALVATIFVFGGATFGSQWSDFALGLARVSFPFFAGIAVYRLWAAEALPAMGVPWFVVFGVLLAAFQIPQVPGLAAVTDALVIVLVFPILVALGSKVTLNTTGARICNLLGELSYPIYILQGGVVHHLRELPHKFGLSGASQYLFIAVALLAYLSACWIALKVYDEPVRRFLTERLRFGRPIPTFRT